MKRQRPALLPLFTLHSSLFTSRSATPASASRPPSWAASSSPSSRPTAVAAEAAPSGLGHAAARGEPYELVVISARPCDEALALAARVRDQPELAGVPIVLLCPTSRPLDAGRCQELRVTRRLVKPV